MMRGAAPAYHRTEKGLRVPHHVGGNERYERASKRGEHEQVEAEDVHDGALKRGAERPADQLAPVVVGLVDDERRSSATVSHAAVGVNVTCGVGVTMSHVELGSKHGDNKGS